MRTLSIPRHILGEMIAHARALAPHECCGMLAGKDGRVTHHYKIATEFEATRVVLNLPEPLHLIISLEKKDAPATAAFRIVNGTVTPVSYQTL